MPSPLQIIIKLNYMYNQTGSWVALASVLALLCQKLGIIIDENTIVTIILGIVALVGVVKQFISHRKLAVATGAIKR